MKFQTIKEQEQSYVVQSYGRVDVALTKGKNATAWDVDGKEYIDFTSGIGVNSLGYCDPGWVKAVTEQAGEIQHISNYYFHPKNTELAQALSELSGLKRTFFCNSGAEANECAIKVARKYGEPHGAYKIITLNNSFHGRTLTTLAATGQEAFHRDFLPLTDGFVYAEINDIESVRALLDGKVCAVMIEMVQGEGGINALEDHFVQDLKALCKESCILLIVDEVQTGVGKTGTFFSYQGYSLEPDIVTCAKGIAGGLPMGVCMVSEQLKDILKPGMQGSTFGGNPVACAGALEVIKRVSEPAFLQSVLDKGQKFLSVLEKHPKVKGIYGKGLMIGVELAELSPVDVMKRCAENGLLILTAKNKVRFLPPLTITDYEIEKGLQIFKEVLDSF